MDQAAQLRNLIKKNQQKPLARVITVTSGKGGVGKSSLSTNLAIQLQRMGNRVVILDADFGLANIEVMLGIRPRSNLADLIFKGKSLQEIITPGPLGIGFISGPFLLNWAVRSSLPAMLPKNSSRWVWSGVRNPRPVCSKKSSKTAVWATSIRFA